MLDPMDCLRDGVPPLLLIDLFGAAGPDAVHIYTDEPADDLSWTHPAARVARKVPGQLAIPQLEHPAKGQVPEARSAGSPNISRPVAQA